MNSLRTTANSSATMHLLANTPSPYGVYTSHWSLSIGISTQANLVTDPYNALHMFV
jgi:hypothetical protein